MPSLGANLIIDSTVDEHGAPSGGTPADALLNEDGVPLVDEDGTTFLVTEDGS